MSFLIQTGLVLFLIAWSGLGLWLVVKYDALFGPHPDDPAETPGARSFGVTHVIAVWFGSFALACYFLIK